jgi:hypothetical protein
MKQELMTPLEIHDFGIEVVVNYLREQGHEILEANSRLGTNPQVVATKDGHCLHVVVRTACYPEKGEIESDEVALRCIEWARKHGATCHFASVGIANATDGQNEEAMRIPVRGAGFYVAFEGLVILRTADRVVIRPSQSPRNGR